MAAEQDVLAIFDRAITYFNQFNFTADSWKTIDGLLDDNAAMKRLDDAGYHQPKADIRNYFLRGNGQADQARFKPRNKDCKVIDDLGFVSGLADFNSLDGTAHEPPSPSRIVAYCFTFVKANGSWKALHLWGTYI